MARASLPNSDLDIHEQNCSYVNEWTGIENYNAPLSCGDDDVVCHEFRAHGSHVIDVTRGSQPGSNKQANNVVFSLCPEIVDFLNEIIDF